MFIHSHYINFIKISICSLILSGCVGYSLKPSLPEGITSVGIKPIVNKTSEPAIELKITEALSDLFNKMVDLNYQIRPMPTQLSK